MPRAPRKTEWTAPSDEDLRGLADELLEEHRVYEAMVDLLYPNGQAARPALSKINESAIVGSLLVRSRMLIDFYWRGPEPRRADAPDAFAEDFFLATSTGLAQARERWHKARAPAAPFFLDWDERGRHRVNRELAHLGYNRLGKGAPPLGDRWWTWSYAWAIVVLTARLFFDAVPERDLGVHGRALLRPFFAEQPSSELVEHVEMFVREGHFPADFGRS